MLKSQGIVWKETDYYPYKEQLLIIVIINGDARLGDCLQEGLLWDVFLIMCPLRMGVFGGWFGVLLKKETIV